MSVLVKVRIEHLSFKSGGEYMDIEARDGYIDISIGGVENTKFSVTLADWEIINTEVRKIFAQDEK